MAGIWKAIDLGAATLDFFKKNGGILEDEVQVRVAGGPRSTKRGLQQVAAAVAFGMVQPLIPLGFGAVPPPGSIVIEYDAAKKEVVFTVRYTRSLMSIFAWGGAGRNAVRALPVFAGPSDAVVGGDFNFRPPVPGGVAPDPTGWVGRTMLTDSLICNDPNPGLPLPGARIPTPNPRPTGDARSRGDLVWLVYQTLAAPADTVTHGYPLPSDPGRFSGT